MLLAALIAWPTTTVAQPSHCIPRAKAVDQLQKKYSEAQVAIGFARGGAILEVFASKHGETWTLFLTLPTGISCVLATGDTWETIPFVLKTGARM